MPRVLISFLVLAIASSLHAADVKLGAALYKAQCARCHGAEGQGAKKHEQPLVGNRSIAQLSTYVQSTMPEDNPGSLTMEQAQAISAHMHEAFYSPIAQERNRPVRIQLTRLTVNQYRQSLTDVVGSFRWQPQWGKEHGLKGEYFKNRRFGNNERVLERVDPQVQFDFGTAAPVAEKIQPHEFSIRWSGALLAPETGEYTFTVRTEHATRLWVNDNKNALIDAWVKSGNDTEYTGNIFLVGGRIYPIRLEYSKAKQGVDDSDKNKTPPAVKSSVTLLWQPPHSIRQTISAPHLAPTPAPEWFVCTTPFPPDDRSLGWERGTSISKEWDVATTDAAIEAANYVAANINNLSGIKGTIPEDKLREFCHTFAERAYRHPLSEEQKSFINRQFISGSPSELSLKRALLLILKSPRFLYREIGNNPGAYDTAARLSYGLWDSIPDEALRKACASNQLQTREQVTTQARRMLTDPRGRAKLQRFMLSWLHADQAHDLAKDPKLFPGFTPEVQADLKESLERSLEDALWSDKADFRQLILTDEIYLNERLAQFYPVPNKVTGDYQKVKLDPAQRAGVLTHPYVMAQFAHNRETSPIHRGVFLARSLLGVSLRPPPEAVAPLPADVHPTLTTRERVVLQTRGSSCISCHSIINPLGFSLEHFDAVGRYRVKDNQKAVDALGSYLTRVGETRKFAGARDLAVFLASSPEVHSSFVEQMFHYLAQQPVRAYGPDLQEQLRKSFAAKDYNIRELAVEIMATTVMKPRPAGQ